MKKYVTGKFQKSGKSELVKNKGYDTMIYHFQCEQKETFRRFAEGVEDNEKRYAVYVKEF